MSEYITSSNAPYGLHRPRKKHYFNQAKIIMPSMFAKNNFAIDYSASVYVGMSFSCIVMQDTEEYLLEYVLAVLNSSIAYEWFYSNGKKRGAGVDIGVEKIKSFPIKKCSIELQKEIADKVRRLHIQYDENIDAEIDGMISRIYEQ